MADKTVDIGPIEKSLGAAVKGITASAKGMVAMKDSLKGLPGGIKNMAESLKSMPDKLGNTVKEIGGEVSKVGDAFKSGMDKSLREQAKASMGGAKAIGAKVTEMRESLIASGVEQKAAQHQALTSINAEIQSQADILRGQTPLLDKIQAGIGPAIKSIPGVFGAVMEKIKGKPDAGDKEKENEEARQNKGIMGVLSKIDAGIGSMGKKIGEKAKGGIKGLGSILAKTALALAIPALMLFMNSPWFGKLADFVKNDLLPGIKNIWEMIKPIAAAISSWIAESAFPVIMNMLIANFKALTQFFSDVFARFSGWSDMSLREKIGAVLGIFTNITELIGKLVGNMIEAVVNLFGGDGAALRKKYWDPIAKFFTDIVDSVMLIFTDPVAGIKKLFATLWDATKGIGGFIFDIAIKPAWNWIKSLFGFGEEDKSTDADTKKGVVGFVTDLVSGIWTWFKSLFDFSSVGSSIASIVNLITLPYNIILGLVTGIWNWFKGIFGFDTKKTDDAGAQTKPGGIGGMLLTLVTGVWTWFKGLFGWGDKKPADSDDSKSGVLGFLTGLVVGVWDWFKGLFDFSSVGKGFASIVNLITLPHQIIFGLVMGVWKWFKGLFGFDTKDTEAAGVQTTPGGIGGILLSLITGVWTWFKGLFGWGTEDEKAGEGFSVSTLITGVFTSIKEWFGKLFKFDSAGGVVASIVNVLTFIPNMIKDLVANVTSWLLGLFGFGDAAKKVANATEWSIGSLVVDAFTAVKDWFLGLFGWGDKDAKLAEGEEAFSLSGLVKGVVKKIKEYFWHPDGKSGLLNFNFGEMLPDIQMPDFGKLIGNLLGGIFPDKWITGEGWIGSAVNAIMPQSLIDLLKEAKGLAAGGMVKPGDFAVVGEQGPELIKFGKAAVVASNEQMHAGRDFAMNAMRVATSGSAGGSGGGTIVNNTSVVAPMNQQSSAVAVSMPIGASDPFTNATRSY